MSLIKKMIVSIALFSTLGVSADLNLFLDEASIGSTVDVLGEEFKESLINAREHFSDFMNSEHTYQLMQKLNEAFLARDTYRSDPLDAQVAYLLAYQEIRREAIEQWQEGLKPLMSLLYPEKLRLFMDVMLYEIFVRIKTVNPLMHALLMENFYVFDKEVIRFACITFAYEQANQK